MFMSLLNFFAWIWIILLGIVCCFAILGFGISLLVFVAQRIESVVSDVRSFLRGCNKRPHRDPSTGGGSLDTDVRIGADSALVSASAARRTPQENPTS